MLSITIWKCHKKTKKTKQIAVCFLSTWDMSHLMCHKPMLLKDRSENNDGKWTFSLHKVFWNLLGITHFERGQLFVLFSVENLRAREKLNRCFILLKNKKRKKEQSIQSIKPMRVASITIKAATIIKKCLCYVSANWTVWLQNCSHVSLLIPKTCDKSIIQ